MNDLIKIKAQGAAVRSRSNWLIHGEKPSKYFLSLEKKKALAKTIHRLKSENDEVLENGERILKEIKDYCEKLYTAGMPCDLTFTDNLEIPVLSDELRLELKESLTVQELSQALKDLANEKASGLDGLPAEFWKMFWPKLKFF